MKSSQLLSLVLLSFTLCACSSSPGQKSVPKKTGDSLVEQKTEGKKCVDNFDMLKGLNYDAFNQYRAQFDKINNSHAYFKSHEGLMEQDPKELMTLTLNDKLNMVCERVKSQAFLEIQKKMKVISQI